VSTLSLLVTLVVGCGGISRRSIDSVTSGPSAAGGAAGETGTAGAADKGGRWVVAGDDHQLSVIEFSDPSRPSTQPLSEYGAVHGPAAWSPDGHELAYSFVGRDGLWQFVIVDTPRFSELATGFATPQNGGKPAIFWLGNTRVLVGFTDDSQPEKTLISGQLRTLVTGAPVLVFDVNTGDVQTLGNDIPHQWLWLLVARGGTAAVGGVRNGPTEIDPVYVPAQGALETIASPIDVSFGHELPVLSTDGTHLALIAHAPAPASADSVVLSEISFADPDDAVYPFGQKSYVRAEFGPDDESLVIERDTATTAQAEGALELVEVSANGTVSVQPNVGSTAAGPSDHQMWQRFANGDVYAAPSTCTNEGCSWAPALPSRAFPTPAPTPGYATDIAASANERWLLATAYLASDETLYLTRLDAADATAAAPVAVLHDGSDYGRFEPRPAGSAMFFVSVASGNGYYCFSSYSEECIYPQGYLFEPDSMLLTSIPDVASAVWTADGAGLLASQRGRLIYVPSAAPDQPWVLGTANEGEIYLRPD
jgi:hypothetical protein